MIVDEIVDMMKRVHMRRVQAPFRQSTHRRKKKPPQHNVQATPYQSNECNRNERPIASTFPLYCNCRHASSYTHKTMNVERYRRRARNMRASNAKRRATNTRLHVVRAGDNPTFTSNKSRTSYYTQQSDRV
jgi:hypothetical protein